MVECSITECLFDNDKVQENVQHGFTNSSRCVSLVDPNVDVIYVSAVPVNEEMAQYYNKLLGLQTAIETGNVDEQSDVSARFKIITPEAINSFPVSRRNSQRESTVRLTIHRARRNGHQNIYKC